MNNFKRMILAICIIIGFAIIATGAFYLFLQQDPITKTTNVTLEIIAAPDFTFTVSSDHLITPINRTASFAATVESVNNFTGEIVFSVPNAPTGVTITFLPSDTVTLDPSGPKGVQVNIVIPDDVNLIGTHMLFVTAKSTNYN